MYSIVVENPSLKQKFAMESRLSWILFVLAVVGVLLQESDALPTLVSSIKSAETHARIAWDSIDSERVLEFLQDPSFDIFNHRFGIGAKNVQGIIPRSKIAEALALGAIERDFPELSVKPTVRKTEAQATTSGTTGGGGRPDLDSFFQDWREYPDIIAQISTIVDANTAGKDNVRWEVIGVSVEKRNIPAILFGRTTGKTVVVSCALHAREWIASAACLWFVQDVLAKRDTDNTVRAFLDAFQVVVLPMGNPDGFQYSHTTDRMWRKNRRLLPDGEYGVDLNRNFDDHFYGSGSVTITSSELYRGPSPFSEPETLAIKNYIALLKTRGASIVAGIDVHSYGQVVYRAYGWEMPSQGIPPNNAELVDIANGIVTAATEVSGYRFTHEPAALYGPAPGACDDWFTGTTTENVGYTFELRDEGQYGFVLPADQIDEGSSEASAGLISFLSSLQVRVSPASTIVSTPSTIKSTIASNICLGMTPIAAPVGVTTSLSPQLMSGFPLTSLGCSSARAIAVGNSANVQTVAFTSGATSFAMSFPSVGVYNMSIYCNNTWITCGDGGLVTASQPSSAVSVVLSGDLTTMTDADQQSLISQIKSAAAASIQATSTSAVYAVQLAAGSIRASIQFLSVGSVSSTSASSQFQLAIASGRFGSILSDSSQGQYTVSSATTTTTTSSGGSGVTSLPNSGVTLASNVWANLLCSVMVVLISIIIN